MILIHIQVRVYYEARLLNVFVFADFIVIFSILYILPLFHWFNSMKIQNL